MTHSRRARLRRLVAWLSLLLLVGLAVLNVLAYNHARAMLTFVNQGMRTRPPEEIAGWAKAKVLCTGVTIPRPSTDLTPADLDPTCRALSIAGEQDITLAAWYCNRGSQTPLVILFHGYASEKAALLPEARACLALGASVLLVDFRGSGGSSESYTTIGVDEGDDVRDVMRYARSELTHRKIILFGHSMGAAAILRAVHQHGIAPDAVIAAAVFDSMLNAVRNRFRAMRLPPFPAAECLVLWGGAQHGFNGFSHKPRTYAASLRCPTLFMHGTDDPRATLAEGRRVFNATPGNKRFETFAKTGHASYLATHPHQWQQAVGALLDDLR